MLWNEEAKCKFQYDGGVSMVPMPAIKSAAYLYLPVTKIFTFEVMIILAFIN